MKELLKLFEKDPALGHEVEVMWMRGASAQEVADMLASKGVGAESAQVEELLAVMQARYAKAIGDNEKVDADQLKRVAGGWCAFWQTAQGMDGSCSYNFKNPTNCSRGGFTACIEDNSDVCLLEDFCDDVYNWYS